MSAKSTASSELFSASCYGACAPCVFSSPNTFLIRCGPCRPGYALWALHVVRTSTCASYALLALHAMSDDIYIYLHAHYSLGAGRPLLYLGHGEPITSCRRYLPKGYRNRFLKRRLCDGLTAKYGKCRNVVNTQKVLQTERLQRPRAA